mgnify:FL=1
MIGTTPLLEAMLFALLAGLAMPLGAALAIWEHFSSARLHDRITHGVTAFGGGALVSAVALVLVPEGAHRLDAPALAVGSFVAGGALFLLIDSWLSKRGGAGSQLLAMLLDFLPQAAALCVILAVDEGTALLLAGLIFLQNVPEGFSAFREMTGTGHLTARRVLPLFAALALAGPACAAAGHLVLAEAPEVLGGIMVFAGGGVLYLVFQDVAPAARRPDDGLPPFGAVMGFALGLAGHLAVG